MDLIIFGLVVWWLGGVLGFRQRRPKRKRRKRSWWYDESYADWEHHNRCNGR